MIKNLAHANLLTLCLLIGQSAVSAEEPLIASAPSLNEEVLSVPGDAEDAPTLFGSNELVVTLLKPAGKGPFPLAVMNHGASGLTMNPGAQPRERGGLAAFYFLSRGYAVALPMLREYAGSNGRQVANHCNQKEAGLYNARDINIIIDYLIARESIDKRQIVVAGQSFGGWNSLAFGTLNKPNVKALVNFVGGLNISNCHSTHEALGQAAKYFGANTRIPSLWFYGENDSIFDTEDWQLMFDQYTAAGGDAYLVNYGRFLTDSHRLLAYPEGLRIWAPRLDAFLTEAGLPGKCIYPEYLPMEFPPPSNFAAIDNVEAVPFIKEKAQEAYRKFLTLRPPKAFVIASSGAFAAIAGGLDPLGKAMKACQRISQACRAYAVDNSVVWTP